MVLGSGIRSGISATLCQQMRGTLNFHLASQPVGAWYQGSLLGAMGSLGGCVGETEGVEEQAAALGVKAAARTMLKMPASTRRK